MGLKRNSVFSTKPNSVNTLKINTNILPENAHKNKIVLYFNLAHTQKIITRDHITEAIRFIYKILTTGMAYCCKVPIKTIPKKVNITKTEFIKLP